MLYGVNLSGAEFGRGNTYAKDYIYPSLSHLQYYASKGVEFVRLPFRWERIQPELNGELNQAELTRIQKFLSNAESTGIKVILDVHNYAGYNNVKIGNGDVTIESFENLWGKLASALKDYSAVAGYGLMNEPTGITAQTWIDAAQSAINAIRAVDIDTAIYVCGTSWSGAHSWLKYNSGLNTLFDPAKNLIFEAHQYFDKDSSGDYSMSYDDEKATPMTGVDRLQPFLTWLQDNDLKGFIGEYSIPDNDPRWQVVMENFLAELADHNVPSAYWGGGPWWGTYPMSIEPDKNGDSLQMSILEKFITAYQEKIALENEEQDALDALIESLSGNDKIIGTSGVDTIHGWDGDDDIWGREGNDHLIGGKGNDHLRGEDGDDYLEGGEGNDTLNGGKGNDVLYGGAGNDKLYAGDGDDWLMGGDGKDMLEGGNGNDTLWAGEGNDTLKGMNGDDILYGEAGDDSLSGGAGNDQLYGGDGDDSLFGDDGDDYMDGGDGDDHLKGGTGDNRMIGGAGNDKLYGEDGDDYLEGGDGNDTLHGGAGNDILDGGAGNDRLYAADGDDWLFGFDGNDMLEGGNGNDTLWGGAGNDTLVGGTGADMFIFREDEGLDRLLDFNFGEGDRLDIGNQTYHAFDTKTGVQLDLSGGGSIALNNVKVIDITDDFFVKTDIIL